MNSNSPINTSRVELVDDLLSQIATEAFASLDTLGVLCLRMAEGSNVHREVDRRYSGWMEKLRQTREEVSKLSMEQLDKELDRLAGSLAVIREFYLSILSASGGELGYVIPKGEDLQTAYRSVVEVLDNVGHAVGFQLRFCKRFNGLRQKLYQQSVDWIVSKARDLRQST